MDSEIDILLWLSPLQTTMDNIASYPVPGVQTSSLDPLTPDMMGELDVLWHNCNPLSVNCTGISFL